MIRNLDNYNYNVFIDIFNEMIYRGECPNSLANQLKRELNSFFRDSNCTAVYFTKNTDKMFFGMKVYPIIKAEFIYKYIMDEYPVRISEYMIEIDSKLLDPIMALEPEELLAFLLHEVGHVINDSTPFDDVKKVLNMYMANNDETLRMSDLIHYKEILAFGLKDYISKRASIMYNPYDDELKADEFVYKCGFGDELDSGLQKICRSSIKTYENTDVSKLTILFWTLRLYRHVSTRRISALKAMSKAKRLVASRIEKMEMENVIRRINRVDDEDLVTEQVIQESISSKMRKIRRDIKQIEDEYYELSMRARNVRDEDDALYIVRKLNTYISILEDYLLTTKYMDTATKEHWQESLTRFKELREQVAKKSTYRVSSDFAIYVNYPDVFTDR